MSSDAINPFLAPYPAGRRRLKQVAGEEKTKTGTNIMSHTHDTHTYVLTHDTHPYEYRQDPAGRRRLKQVAERD